MTRHTGWPTGNFAQFPMVPCVRGGVFQVVERPPVSDPASPRREVRPDVIGQRLRVVAFALLIVGMSLSWA